MTDSKPDVKDEPDFIDNNSLDGTKTTPVFEQGTVDPVYQAKAHVLNNAVQQIGMGKYQWELFVLVGFGWAADNMWPIITSLILQPVALEFNQSRPPLLSLAQNIGLLAGAIFWGFGCDIFGRRLAFNATIGITAVFGLIAAGSPNFAAIGCFAALWSFGVGGNLPVDSAVFLEFLPGSHQYLLTILSIYWALAQLLATLVAWPLLGYRTCSAEQTTPCTRSQNFGWRYFMIAMGGFSMICFILRFVFFTLYESPKYLMGKRKDAEAVAVVHKVALKNSKTSTLSVADLEIHNAEGQQATDAAAALKRKLEKIDLEHVRALFRTRRLAYSTTLIIFVWAFVGLAYPLYNAFIPYTLTSRGASFGDGSTYLTYRNSLIIAVLGIPGALLGGVLVEVPKLGRKGALALATTLTGVFLFGSTTARNSNSLLGWNCAFSFMSNVMYAVLYAYTPEIFPTKDRGTGNALTASANRIFGIMAPIIAIYANLETAAPVYDISVFRRLLDGFQGSESALKKEQHDRDEDIRAKDAIIKELQDDQAKAERDFKEQLTSKSNEVDNLQRALNDTKERERVAQKECLQKDREISQLNFEASTLDTNIEQKGNRISQMEQQITSLHLAMQETEYEVSTLNTDVEQKVNQISQLEQNITSLESTAKEMEEQHATSLHDRDSTIETLQKDLAIGRRDAARLNGESERNFQDLETALERREQDLDGKVKMGDQEIEKLKQDIQAIHKDRDAIQHNLETTMANRRHAIHAMLCLASDREIKFASLGDKIVGQCADILSAEGVKIARKLPSLLFSHPSTAAMFLAIRFWSSAFAEDVNGILKYAQALFKLSESEAISVNWISWGLSPIVKYLEAGRDQLDALVSAKLCLVVIQSMVLLHASANNFKHSKMLHRIKALIDQSPLPCLKGHDGTA